MADTAIWLALSGGAARLGAVAIREWAAVQRGRRVRLTRGDEEIEIEGVIDPTAARLLEEFLGKDSP
ncbi:hypothetical protein FDA94_38280 [Herbidospora galbida]|uniref:Uncharacterized protein n=2 Tax=Herbidospora galbida TaxID=2575442 RepID=A0A4U3LNG4_9ACTN|nr:hypothetical protein FDA94_38280 [Herbidospora galbida]